MGCYQYLWKVRKVETTRRPIPYKQKRQPLADPNIPCLGKGDKWCDSSKSLPDLFCIFKKPKIHLLVPTMLFCNKEVRECLEREGVMTPFFSYVMNRIHYSQCELPTQMTRYYSPKIKNYKQISGVQLTFSI